MNDEELEKQARLWLVESVLPNARSQALQGQLQRVAPAARMHHKGKLIGAILALVAVPVAGITITALNLYRLPQSVKIEPLEFFPGGKPIGKLLLGPDGTVASTYTFEATLSSGSVFWKPGQSRPQRIGLNSITAILPNGSVVGNVYILDNKSAVRQEYSAIWQADQLQPLQPLAGSTSALAHWVVNDDIIGRSSRPSSNPRETTKNEKWTLWHNNKPEPLEKYPLIKIFASSDSLQTAILDTNAQNEFLISQTSYGSASTSPGRSSTSARILYSVDSPNKRIPVICEERDQSKNLLGEANPMFLGKNGMIVGMMSHKGVAQVALWTSPSAAPHPLWGQNFSFSPLPTECVDADDEGSVVGTMTNPLTESKSLFLWKDNRYFELQRLLPANSGWQLTSVLRVTGRFIVGVGTYQGKPCYYRMTLPQGFP